ncbi:MAG: ABC transporter substrate-binding protein [Myxococcota bacterium]
MTFDPEPIQTTKTAHPRVVSLLPSATEIVCAVGAADGLVGISHECDHPPSIRDRRVLTKSRVAPVGSSRAIDRAVRSAARDALSVYQVDEVALAELAPDIIVTQDLCEVCAVSLDDVRSAVARAHRDDIEIMSLKPTRLQDMLDDVKRVATQLGRREQGVRVRSALESRIEGIRLRSAAASTRPRVVSIEWLDPVMLGGTWMPELIELAGGTPCGVRAGAPAPTVSPSDLVALDPEVVLLKPCGFTLERTLRERDVIETQIRGPLGSKVRVVATDGNAYFNRPGPRLVESLEILAAVLHPELFPDFVNAHASVIVPLDAR